MNENRKNIRDGFFILNLYLWIHGIGFTQRYRCTKNDLMILLLSVLLALIFDVNILYDIFTVSFDFEGKSTNFNKDLVVSAIIALSSILLRILIYCRRKDMTKVTSELIEICSFLKRKRIFNAKIHVIGNMLIADSVNVILICLLCYITKFFIDKGMKKGNFYFGIVSLPYSSWFSFLSAFIVIWGKYSSLIALYFCQICWVLKNVLNELNIEFKRRPKRDKYCNLVKFYNKIMLLIDKINDTFKVLILVDFCFTLLGVFQPLYKIFFTEGSSYIRYLFLVLLAFNNFFQFTQICIYSSSVRCSALKLKETIQDLPIDLFDSENLRFLLKVNERFVGFKLFESIVIDSTLIMWAVGTLLTYGILIATFNVST